MAIPILLTGATGYIGGSFLTLLLADSQTRSAFDISVLVRKPEQVSVFEQHGVKAVLFRGLDDLEGLAQAASENDGKS
jgi:uncharacterized protein YbjT (DUF2867 family)